MSEENDLRDKINELENCQHRFTAVRRIVNSAGVDMFKSQCLVCGRGVGNFLKREAVPMPVDEWDKALENTLNRLREVQREAMNEQINARKSKWWQDYSEYLKSEQWKARRRMVLERDGHWCQACRLAPATQVHHLTYKHVFHEPLFDLIAVCDECHEDIHEPYGMEAA